MKVLTLIPHAWQFTDTEPVLDVQTLFFPSCENYGRWEHTDTSLASDIQVTTVYLSNVPHLKYISGHTLHGLPWPGGENGLADTPVEVPLHHGGSVKLIPASDF